MIKLKELIIRTAYHAKEGHIPSAFSIFDILWVLYDRVMKYDPKDPKKTDRDIFILSKGHASLGLYAVLAEKGFFSKDEFDTFCKFESILGGHPDCRKVPGVEASTGSLGHGFPIAVGHAMGIKIKRGSNKVFTIIGDGEANEGTVWESALLGAHHKLNNLYCIVDFNHSTDRALDVGDLVKKFDAFGWHTLEVDGHNQEELYKALTTETVEKPIAIIANTIKGKGCKLMENEPAWHHKCPNEDELVELLSSLY